METETDYDMVVDNGFRMTLMITYLELWISDGQYNHSGYANAEYDKLLKDLRQRQMLRQDRICCSRQNRSSLVKNIPLLYRFSYVERHLLIPTISNFNVDSVLYDFDLVYADISE